MYSHVKKIFLPGVLIVSISSEIEGTVGMDCEFIGAALIGVFCGVGAVTFLFFISTKQKLVKQRNLKRLFFTTCLLIHEGPKKSEEG